MFCLGCNAKYQQAQDAILYRLEREHNRLLDEIDMISGIPTTGGRYPERKPPVTMSGTFNNIRIDRSTIGAVNTGTVQSLQVSLAGIRQGGDEELARALKEMTEGVLKSSELLAAQKDEALELLETLASEAARPKPQRRSTAMRAVVSAFSEIAKTGASLSTLWAQHGSTIEALFK
jgi:hypothetical protein